MPRYFFNLRNDVLVDDVEGRELADAEAARACALESARALICEEVEKGHVDLGHRIEVVDEAGGPVLTVTFREAFTTSG